MRGVKKYSKSTLAVLLILWSTGIAFIGPAFCADDRSVVGTVRIDIQPSSQVKASEIFLEDIAQIEAHGFLKEALNQIRLDRSPDPGQIKRLVKERIISTIKRQKYLPDHAAIRCPAEIYVKRLSQKISKDRIQALVDARIKESFKGKSYEISSFDVSGLERYPAGEVLLQLDSDTIVNSRGKIYGAVNVLIDGKREDRLQISGKAAVFDTVFLAARYLKKGEQISRTSVYSAPKNIFENGSDGVRTWEALAGKIVSSGMNKDAMILKNKLADPPLVKKGDVIKLFVKKNHLLIVASGISKENGYQNELIKVENISSGKLVRGIVKAPSEVEVVY